MSKMQATYEKQFNGHWQLVVYHDGIHNDPLNKVTKQGCFDIPPEMIDKDGSPNFAFIKSQFPEPKEQ